MVTAYLLQIQEQNAKIKAQTIMVLTSLEAIELKKAIITLSVLAGLVIGTTSRQAFTVTKRPRVIF